jgi:opacity protein-like surface antigen
MKLEIRIALALTATALMPLTPVLAADYDPPIYVDQAPEYTPVEIGSGWYLRGDVAYMPEQHSRNVDFGLAAVAYSERENPLFASVGFGYHFNDYLRAELNLGYLPGDKASATYDDGIVSAAGSLRNKAWTGMVNGYVDLGTYVGLTPYIGAGAGIYRSNRSLNASYTDANNPADNFVLSDSKTQYSFAYTLNAGVAYQLSKNVQFDLGYQYLSAPDAEYAAVENLVSYPIHKGLDYHQIKVGLRYDLW